MLAPDSGRIVELSPADCSEERHPVHPVPTISSKWSDRVGLSFSRFAGGIKRALGMSERSMVIMNAPSSSSEGVAKVEASPADVGLRLQRTALGLFGEFVRTGDDGVSLVDYSSMRSSAGFAEYLQLTDQLRCLEMRSPEQIGSRDDQMAFWLNLCAARRFPAPRTAVAPALCCRCAVA
jgi:hypothetical protein